MSRIHDPYYKWQRRRDSLWLALGYGIAIVSGMAIGLAWLVM